LARESAKGVKLVIEKKTVSLFLFILFIIMYPAIAFAEEDVVADSGVASPAAVEVTMETLPLSGSDNTSDQEGAVSSALSPAVTGLGAVDMARIAAQNGDLFSNILHRYVPYGSLKVKGTKSLFSMLLSIIGMLFAIFLFVGQARGRRQMIYDYDRDEMVVLRQTQKKLAKIVSAVFGIITGVPFLILDRFHQPSTWINHNTPYVASAFTIFVFFLVVSQFIPTEGRGPKTVAKDMNGDI
jgi:intracellular septation protein A